MPKSSIMASNAKQSILITGCSKDGIGDALAQEFLSRGFRVFATARDLRKIEHLKEIGCDVLALDVVDEKSIRKAAEIVREETRGALHYLINNAGLSKPSVLAPRQLTLFSLAPCRARYDFQNTTRSLNLYHSICSYDPGH
jgi:1-acylglycerone phosphate reductase